MEEQVVNSEIKNIPSEEKRYNIQLNKNDKKYIFSVPDGTPLGEAYDSCAEILYALSNMIQEATKKMMPQQSQDEAQVTSVESEVVNKAN